MRKTIITLTYIWDDDRVGTDPCNWDLYDLLDIGAHEMIINVNLESAEITDTEKRAFEEENPIVD